MATQNVVCSACGFSKNPSDLARCISCGAKVEALFKGSAQTENPTALFQQEELNGQWIGIALLVQVLLTGVIIFGLPTAIRFFDFEGGNGMLLCIPVWFLGGLITARLSPGRTFAEPTIASFFVSIPSTFLLIQSQTVRTMPTFLYVITAAIGILFTLVGAYLGELLQLGPQEKRV
ncbi:hypothetical protein [Pajaroellobacter abortibovis]|uniref:Uncharacterized protein n=1 Tax=Pajaroellobacter abortibovis TaxID=1882918 RepID=A0A1L6MVL0_9BACT|nr:hypothetical protein [Pajaroellobacter abortibovis]APR99583.1 hypothetical protein BCY86_01975 [Pajaroellobacter abortibovis]